MSDARQHFRAPDEFLQAFHAEHPGATSQAFEHGLTAAGVSSYDLLAQFVPDDAWPRTVVDLACGDGYLLARLAAHASRGLRLIGIDASAAELAAARARLGPAIALSCERAHALSLPAASVDCVLSHMAMMLLAPIEPVLGEIRRVLRPGGTFAAVVGRGYGEDPVGAAFLLALKHEMQNEAVSLGRLGDPRIREAEGLRELFSPEQGFEALTIEDFDLHLDAPAETIWAELALIYDVALLSSSGKRRLEAVVRELCHGCASEAGIVPHRMGMRLFTCRRGEGLPSA